MAKKMDHKLVAENELDYIVRKYKVIRGDVIAVKEILAEKGYRSRAKIYEELRKKPFCYKIPTKRYPVKKKK